MTVSVYEDIQDVTACVYEDGHDTQATGEEE
jgi:hypothetical protein